MRKKLIFAAALIILAASIIIFNCAPKELVGTLIENESPTISFTNLPLEDSTFTSSARIYWYGIDSDGYIDEYYYIVVGEDSVQGDADGYIANILDTLSITQWSSTDSTNTSIQLFAMDDEEDSLQQYIFVKCKDDDGEYSNTIYMNLFRRNHMPETYLELLPGNHVDEYDTNGLMITDLVWSLPDTNALWEGFEINWNGDDTLDFAGEQPNFQYLWKMYGPFDLSHYDQDLKIIDITPDSVDLNDLFAFSCSDGELGACDASQWPTDSGWVWNQTITFSNVPTGCYLFTVRVRDDAEVEDSTDAWGTFACVVPKWIEEPDSAKDILVIQATQYRTISIRGWPADTVYAPDDTLQETPLYFPTLDTCFYAEMIQGAGDYSYTIYGEPAVGGETEPIAIPSIPEIAKYRMIIIDDMDYMSNDPQKDPLESILYNYLSAGGKAWVIGRQSFYYGNGSNEDEGEYQLRYDSLAIEFFDLSSYRLSQRNIANDSAEFVGATSAHSGFNTLVTDTTRTRLLRQYGINKVDVFSRFSSHSEGLFKYQAAQPDTMIGFQNMPVALRFFPEHEVFKTSYFGFPLFLMDNSDGDVQDVFTNMLDWFLNED
ncbi:MAG: hypothetical protein J7K40_14140 [candidate division Zixibacteria bacterium]|nr:hypothetical protein [candidate division Zixibacteria bacterium]